MITIPHTLKFETEFDENNPTAKRLLALPAEMQVAMLEGMLKQFLVPVIKDEIDRINEGSTYALLKVSN